MIFCFYKMEILEELKDLSIYDNDVVGKLFYIVKRNNGVYKFRTDDIIIDLLIFGDKIYGYICNLNYMILIYQTDDMYGDITMYKHRYYQYQGYDVHNIKKYCHVYMERYVGRLTVSKLLCKPSLLDLLMENRDLDINCGKFTDIVLHFMLFSRNTVYVITSPINIVFTTTRRSIDNHPLCEGFITNGRYIILMNIESYFINLTYVQTYDEQLHNNLHNYINNDMEVGKIIKFHTKVHIDGMKFSQFIGSKVKSAYK